MTPDQVLTKAGDVSIEEIKIITTQGFYQDITNQVMAIQIYEDLFSPFMTGTLEVRDSLDLLNVFPLNGEEFLHMKINTPTLQKGNIDHKFYIFKMADKMPIGDRSDIYTLHFISEEALLDVNKKISKTFEGRCSEIAKRILTDKQFGLQSNKEFVIEDTSNSTKYISNFWSPIKNLVEICATSVNQNGNASYVFYENRFGFNFVSLEYLYQQDHYQLFQYDAYVRDVDTNSNVSTRNVTEDYKRIRTVNVPTVYDYVDRNRKGMFASKMITYDPVTKRYNNKNFDMIDVYSRQNHLNKFAYASNKSIYKYSSYLLNMTKYTGNFTGYGDVTNTGCIQNRTSLLSQAEAGKLEITVPGRLDYTVGLKVELKFFKTEPIEQEDSEIVDSVMSGNYIISAINHYINRKRHECTIEVIKDSLLIDLDRSK